MNEDIYHTKSLFWFGRRNEKLVRISVNMARGRFFCAEQESGTDGMANNEIFLSRFYFREKSF